MVMHVSHHVLIKRVYHQILIKHQFLNYTVDNDSHDITVCTLWLTSRLVYHIILHVINSMNRW